MKDSVAKRIVEVDLERGLNLGFEMNRSRIVRRHFELFLNLAARAEERRKNYPKGCRKAVAGRRNREGRHAGPNFVEENSQARRSSMFELRQNVGGNIMTRMDHGTASHYSPAEVVNA